MKTDDQAHRDFDNAVAESHLHLEQRDRAASERDSLRADLSRLRSVLSTLLSQADEVHRYSSWLGMCDYLNLPDARVTARNALAYLRTADAPHTPASS